MPAALDTQDVRAKLSAARDEHETRAERLGALIDGGRIDPLSERVTDAHYHEGAAYALSYALSLIEARP